MLQHRAIKSRASKRRNHTAAGILFALPWIIGFLAFSLYPIIMSVYYSLTDFNMFQTPKFVGLENYSALFQDEKFYKSLGNTLYMTVLGTPLCLVAGLLLAVLLNQKVRAMPIFPNVLLSSQHRAACRILHAVAVDFEPAVRPFEQHPAETGAVPAQLADRPAFYETCAADHGRVGCRQYYDHLSGGAAGRAPHFV